MGFYSGSLIDEGSGLQQHSTKVCGARVMSLAKKGLKGDQTNPKEG